MSYTLNVPGWGKFQRTVLATAGAACLLLGSSVAANAWVIDFEGLDDPGPGNGLIIDNEYAGGSPGTIPGTGVTASFETRNYNFSSGGHGVLFDTDNPTGDDPDLGAPFCMDAKCGQGGTNPINPGHVLIIHEKNYHDYHCNSVYCVDPDDEADIPAGKITITFSEKVILDSIDFFDVEHGEGSTVESNEIELFVDGNQILNDMFYRPETGGDNTWDVVDFGGVGVDKIKINVKGSGALDNITGRLMTMDIPEPASAGLFAVGMVAFGALRRRRKQVEVAADT